MLCSLIWLFTYTGLPGLHTHMHTHTRMPGKQNTYSSMWSAVIIFSSDTSPSCCRSSSGACWFPCCIQIQLFFSPLFFFFIFSLCWNKYMYLTRAPTKKVVVGAEVPVLPFANSVSKHQPFFQERGDKIATRWKAQIPRRHMALNNLWPSKIETAT